MRRLGHPAAYLERARIFLRFRFKRRIRFLAHLARISATLVHIHLNHAFHAAAIHPPQSSQQMDGWMDSCWHDTMRQQVNVLLGG